jgi:DNA-directed RNA polymerase subunit RPC12/RpoP
MVKQKYICSSCNFGFMSDRPSECPYCGKKTLEKDRDAETFLKDIDDILVN